MRSETLDHHVRVLKTMADATRLRILGLLAEHERSGAELAAALELSGATISHHMHRLTDVGIVRATAAGRRTLYRLDDALLGTLAREGETREVALPDDDAAFRARTLRSFVDGERLRSIPAKRRPRVVVLMWLLQRFEPGRAYSEQEVNDLLRWSHEDTATLRRELVDYRYLTRSGGTYRVAEAPTARDAQEVQEVPKGEAAWLAALIDGIVRSN